MLLPRLWMDDMFDDDYEDRRPVVFHTSDWMRTDVKETDKSYEMDMNLPGFKKEDVKVTVKDGYLTVKATSSNESKDTDKEGKLIRQERYSGTCQRSFYIGEDIKKEDIKAKYNNGVLHLSVPKVEAKPVETEQFIEIE